jgi:diacylglycerol kinase family enzyme
MVNDDYHANMAALGLSPAIGRSVPHLAKRYLGKIGYLITAVWRFPLYRSFRCRVTRPGFPPLDVDALEVLIANGGYHCGTLLVPQADVESSDLVVHMVVGTDKWRLPWAWLRAWLGMPEFHSSTVTVRADTFSLETLPPQDISIDGEVVTRTPVRCTVAWHTLKIIVPIDFSRSSAEDCPAEA